MSSSKVFFDDTEPDRAALIDQPGIFRHTTVAKDIFWWQAETEVFVSAITQFLLVGWIDLDVRLICQEQVKAVSASGAIPPGHVGMAMDLVSNIGSTMFFPSSDCDDISRCVQQLCPTGLHTLAK